VSQGNLSLQTDIDYLTDNTWTNKNATVGQYAYRFVSLFKSKQLNPKFYSVDSMTKDLSLESDRPAWLLSSYGPAKYEPNLVSGIDESFEELHLKAALALASNSVQEYVCYHTSTRLAHPTYAVYRSNMKPKRLRPLTRFTPMLETMFSRLMTKPRRTQILQSRTPLQLLVPLVQ
jgi:hypothetical protein